MSNLAPIALFVYNRPEHTQRTLQALKQNTLASESKLFIFSDGPQTAADTAAVNHVRSIIHAASGFKSVEIIERKRNCGLANSIIAGVSTLIARYEKLIIFEDDLVSSPYALCFFNEALNRYSNEPRVMQIAAYMFPLKNTKSLTETFFVRSANSWGWATWKRAWNHFDPDINRLYQQFDKQKIYDFTLQHTMNYWKQFMDFKNGKNDSWAIRWNASIFLNHGLVLHPSQSLIKNIGHDGTGVHSIIEDTYDVHMSTKPISFFPEIIREDDRAISALQHFFKHRKGSLLKRGRKFIINRWYKFKNRFV